MKTTINFLTNIRSNEMGRHQEKYSLEKKDYNPVDIMALANVSESEIAELSKMNSICTQMGIVKREQLSKVNQLKAVYKEMKSRIPIKDEDGKVTYYDLNKELKLLREYSGKEDEAGKLQDGMLRMSLRSVPGKNLSEKIKAINSGKLNPAHLINEATNG